jgi:hypothetical protein
MENKLLKILDDISNKIKVQILESYVDKIKYDLSNSYYNNKIFYDMQEKVIEILDNNKDDLTEKLSKEYMEKNKNLSLKSEFIFESKDFTLEKNIKWYSFDTGEELFVADVNFLRTCLDYYLNLYSYKCYCMHCYRDEPIYFYTTQDLSKSFCSSQFYMDKNFCGDTNFCSEGKISRVDYYLMIN